MQSVALISCGHRSLALQPSLFAQRIFKNRRGFSNPGLEKHSLIGRRATERIYLASSPLQLCASWQQSQQADAVPVVFSVEQKVDLGDSVSLVGDHSELGNWDVGNAAHMTWGEGHIWETALWLSPGTTIEFKCVRHGKNGERWEKGRNRVLTIPSDTVAKVEIELTWGGEMEVTTQKEPANEQSGGHNSWGADKVEQLSSNSLVPVTISINREVGMGQSHVLVGSHPAVGEWKIGAGAHMKWEDGNVWHSSLELEPGTSLEFKCVEVGNHGEVWERGPNRVLNIPSNGMSSVAVELEWGADMMVTAQPAESQSQPTKHSQHSWEKDSGAQSKWGSEIEASKPFDWGSWGQSAQEEVPVESKEMVVETNAVQGRESASQSATKDSSSANKLLEEAVVSLEAERQFSERMMAALRSVKQQASDANEKWAKAEKLLRGERNRIKELESEVHQLRKSFSQASDAVVQMREEISALQQQLSQSNGSNSSSSSWDDSKQTRVNGRPRVNGHSSKWTW